MAEEQTNDSRKEIDALLDGVLHGFAGGLIGRPAQSESLSEMFERRLDDLRIKKTTALKLMNMNLRSLNGILEGTQSQIDVLNLVKFARFVRRPETEVFGIFLEALQRNKSTFSDSSIEKRTFLQNNFDLPALKRVGLIDDLNDFEKIESRIVSILGLRNIFEFQTHYQKPAFSSGVIQPKNELTRLFFRRTMEAYAEKLEDPYRFDREKLIEFFKDIRFYTQHVEHGFLRVVKALYQLGVTVLYIPPLPGAHIRGACIHVNGKPVVAITNYRGFYGTLWFALVHELFHVLFHFDEISEDRYHLSQSHDEEDLVVAQKEAEANDFAREYLFPKSRMELIKHNLNNPHAVAEFAKVSGVHESLIYVFAAFESGNNNYRAWARARRFEPASWQRFLFKMENPWNKPMPLSEFISQLKREIFT